MASDELAVRFIASFSTFSCLENDERTRTFLTLEFGAGNQEVSTGIWSNLMCSSCHRLQAASLSKSLNPTLDLLRQKLFYSEPRFHASIAWALLSRPGVQSSSPGLVTYMEPPEDDLPPSSVPSITCLPESVVAKLNTRFGKELANSKTGAFLVDRVCTKVGKDTSVWRLGQPRQS